jgi:hypothetical protein
MAMPNRSHETHGMHWISELHHLPLIIGILGEMVRDSFVHWGAPILAIIGALSIYILRRTRPDLPSITPR